MLLNQNQRILQYVKTQFFLEKNKIIDKSIFEIILKETITDDVKTNKILLLIPEIEDDVINDPHDMGLLYSVLSDHPDGSECGPWSSDVYGTHDLWFKENAPDGSGFFMFSSVDYDELFFSSYGDACSAADDHAHEDIIEIINNFKK